MTAQALADDRRPCILVGTCISSGIRYLLQLSEEFRTRYRLTVYRTDRHTQFMSDFAIGDEELAGCDTFIYHPPGWADWGNDQGYRDLIARTPGHVRRISYPYPVFHPLWPFHCWDKRNEDPDRRRTPAGEPAFYPYGDSYILGMLRRGFTRDRIVEDYLALDVASLVSLDDLLQKCIDIQAEKEKNTDVKVVDFIVENFRSRRVFMTMNHVGNATLIYMADQILAALGCRPLGRYAHEALQELVRPEMPIHPAVARHFNLSCVSPETRYRVDPYRLLTFGEWVADYVDFA